MPRKPVENGVTKPAYRKREQVTLASQWPGLFEQLTAPPTNVSSPYVPRADRYEAVYKTMKARYLQSLNGYERARRYEADTTDSGFRAIAQLLAYATPTYLAYCQETSQTAHVKHLKTALLASSRVPGFFQRMDIDDNDVYEESLGLSKRDYPKLNGSRPFVITQSPDDSTQFQLCPDTLTQIQNEDKSAVEPMLRIHNDLPKVKSYEQCPARGKFTQVLWAAGVELCTQDPNLFPRDLNSGLRTPEDY